MYLYKVHGPYGSNFPCTTGARWTHSGFGGLFTDLVCTGVWYMESWNHHKKPMDLVFISTFND